MNAPVATGRASPTSAGRTPAGDGPGEGPDVGAARGLSTGARVRVPSILQMAEVECGAASLAMILAQWGRWVPSQEMRAACGISRDGATALDIVKAGRHYGVEGHGHIGDVSKLSGLEMPAIIWLRRSHFVVLEGAKDGVFSLNDPANGRYSYDAEEFVENYSGAVITFTQTEAFEAKGRRVRVTSRLAQRLRRSRTGAVFAIVAGLLATLLGLSLGPLSELFVNDVLSLDRRGGITVLASALLAVGVLRTALTLLEYGVLTRLQSKLSLVGSASFLDHLLRLPVEFYMQRSTGDLSQRITYTTRVAQLLATQVAAAGIAVVGIVGYGVLLLYYQWQIAVVVLALSALNVVALRTVLDRRRTAQQRVTHQQNELRGTTVSALKTIETLKATGMEDDTFTSLTGQQAHYISAQSSMVTSTALLGAIPTFLLALSSAAILMMGGHYVIEGSLTFGGLLAVQTLAAAMNAPVQTLMSAGSQIQVITANVESLDDVEVNPLDARYERDPDGEVPTFDGSLRLDHVTFGYSTMHRPVITDLSLDLEPGARVALVGVSGAGKSTIGNLAAGLLVPWGGQVTFTGLPADAYPLRALERPWAKVDQTIVLFEGTVRENITLWDSTVPTNDVRDALRDAQVLDDVLARPGGLDARVEEDGRNFSGGQRQRLEIARALALNPRALILDEATSALDTTTESLVDDALRARGLTCLIIAHRLSTIRDADEIVVLGPQGAVLERGTHAQLMARDGEYAELVGEAGDGGDVGT